MSSPPIYVERRQRNLELAFPEKTVEERQVLLIGCFRSLGRELGVFSKFLTGSPSLLRSFFDVSGLEELERRRRPRVGASSCSPVISAHGN
jgi:lauroyl/myristoyl acyltransferase